MINEDDIQALKLAIGKMGEAAKLVNKGLILCERRNYIVSRDIGRVADDLAQIVGLAESRLREVNP